MLSVYRPSRGVDWGWGGAEVGIPLALQQGIENKSNKCYKLKNRLYNNVTYKTNSLVSN